MRYGFRIGFAFALGLALMAGCSEAGSGGTAGIGGSGATPECQGPEECDDFASCTIDSCTDGTCEYTTAADGTACEESNECIVGMCERGVCHGEGAIDGTACGGGAGTCYVGSCQVACTEQGIRDAIATGGGPYIFDCGGPIDITTETEIVIGNNVWLQGWDMRVHGEHENAVVSINEGVTARLEGFMLTGGTCTEFACSPAVISNAGRLILIGSSLSNEPGQGGAGLENEGTATLYACVLSSNLGGGVVSSGNLTLTNSTVSDNENWGIHVAGGTLLLTGTDVLGNGGRGLLNEGTATLMGCTIAENSSGGIYNAGALTVLSTTVSNNKLAIDSGLAGGGIDNDGTVILANSTISGNTAARGGGIHNEASLTLLSSTLANNTATTGTAVSTTIRPGRDYATIFGGTLIQGNCSSSQPIESTGYNIESPGNTCGFNQTGDQAGVSAEQLKLGPLAYNGGRTMTHALGEDSVAIDVIPAEDCVDADGAQLATDQRGEPRDSMCDVGAFERSARDAALATYCAAVLECFPDDESCEADFVNFLWVGSGGDFAACTSAKVELVECAASSDCDKLAQGLLDIITEECVDQLGTVYSACEVPVK